MGNQKSQCSFLSPHPSVYSPICSSFFMSILLLINYFIYLCLCWSLFLHGCFSSCKERALLKVAFHHGSFSCCRAGLQVLRLQELQFPGSRVQAQQLWLRAQLLRGMGIFLDQDPTHLYCIGRWILYPLATRDAPVPSVLNPTTSLPNEVALNQENVYYHFLF